LLSGLPGAGFVAGPGEHYSEPGYRPPILPPALVAVRSVLFGLGPDRRAVLYRLAQFLALVDTTPLAADLTAADPRRTDTAPPLVDPGFGLGAGTTAVPMGSAPPLYLIGDPPGQDSRGRLEFTWILEVLP
jgi:hypothetical protein